MLQLSNSGMYCCWSVPEFSIDLDLMPYKHGKDLKSLQQLNVRSGRYVLSKVGLQLRNSEGVMSVVVVKIKVENTSLTRYHMI